MKAVRGNMRMANMRGRRGGPMRGRGGYGVSNGGNICPNFYEPPCQPPFEIDFTEDIQMSGPTHHHWENEHDRKRNSVFKEHPAKKPRMEGPHSLLPTPAQPNVRGRPINNHQFTHPGFCPPQEMAPQPGPRRFFQPGPRGAPRPMGPMNPRGPARFPSPHFNRPGPPGPPPMGFRPTFPIAHRGLPPTRGGPYPNRGFDNHLEGIVVISNAPRDKDSGGPRMFRP